MSRTAWCLSPALSYHDPLTFGANVVVPATVAWLASYVPARRTTRVDPMITMRVE